MDWTVAVMAAVKARKMESITLVEMWDVMHEVWQGAFGFDNA